MNKSIARGIVAFVAWSAFSVWYYVCQISDLCSQDKVVVATEVYPAGQSPVAAPLMADSPKTAQEAPQSPISISKTITFSKNTIELTGPGAFASFVDSLSQLAKDQKIEVVVVGHTCNLGTEDYNLKLGMERAAIVADLLKADIKRLADVKIQSRGESEPLLPNTSEQNRNKNRRVTFTITFPL